MTRAGQLGGNQTGVASRVGRGLCLLGASALLLRAGVPAMAATLTIDFEELPVASSGVYNGSDQAGGFTTYGLQFNNHYVDFGTNCCWNGWAYSRTNDPTTPGPQNQYSAWPGSGAGGSPTYGIAFSGADAGGGIVPEIDLPAGVALQSLAVANTTYAALSMQLGDGFAKRFGGPEGSDPDWFRLTVEGRNEASELVGAVSVLLADYRFANSQDDYIVNGWISLDLTPLTGLGVRTLAFRLQSTDNGQFGMNTPAYVAVDNLVVDAVGQPGDFNLDGSTDQADLDVWQRHFGSGPDADLTNGDADGNHRVDGADLLAWQRSVSFGAASAAMVPEPCAWLLLASGLLAGGTRAARSHYARRTKQHALTPHDGLTIR